jgi:hypothetical protein
MVLPIPSPLEQAGLVGLPRQSQPQMDQIVFFLLSHQRAVAQAEVAQHPVVILAKTVVRAVVAVKETQL